MGLKVRRDGEKGEMRYGSRGIGRLCTYYYAVTVDWALKSTCYLSFYSVRIRHDTTFTVNWALKTTYYLSLF